MRLKYFFWTSAKFLLRLAFSRALSFSVPSVPLLSVNSVLSSFSLPLFDPNKIQVIQFFSGAFFHDRDSD